jgi:8-oxo-dGTP pyrophosphatase MutT (NUDIX family)
MSMARERRLAVGLCVRPTDGALLVEHGFDHVAGDRFYRAIGGECEPGEDSSAAVIREWREEFALSIRVTRTLGTLDNRFVYEGRAGHEHVTVFEVEAQDPAVYALARLERYDPEGLPHIATWLLPAALGADAPPLYPDGVLRLLQTAG